MEAGGSTVAAALAFAVARLGSGARSEAEILLADALDRPRAWLFAHSEDCLGRDSQLRFEQLVAARQSGAPIAQITGRKGFWSLELDITRDVLIPRAETELLVEQALAVLPPDVPLHVADLGTGSGAVALAIACERPLADLVAVDASAAALAVARLNVRKLGLSARVSCVQGDWVAPLDDRRFHAIVSNPPYIAEDDPHLTQGDLRFEPRTALASGSDGLDAIRTIVDQARARLLQGAWLLIEHGWEQGAAVRALFEVSGYADIATHRDLEARERVTCGRWLAAENASI